MPYQYIYDHYINNFNDYKDNSYVKQRLYHNVVLYKNEYHHFTFTLDRIISKLFSNRPHGEIYMQEIVNKMFAICSQSNDNCKLFDYIDELLNNEDEIEPYALFVKRDLCVELFRMINGHFGVMNGCPSITLPTTESNGILKSYFEIQYFVNFTPN